MWLVVAMAMPVRMEAERKWAYYMWVQGVNTVDGTAQRWADFVLCLPVHSHPVSLLFLLNKYVQINEHSSGGMPIHITHRSYYLRLSWNLTLLTFLLYGFLFQSASCSPPRPYSAICRIQKATIKNLKMGKNNYSYHWLNYIFFCLFV